MDEAPSSQNHHHVVVALDMSDLGRRTLVEAVHWASARSSTELHAVMVAETHGTLLKLPGDTSAVSEDAARERARQYVADCVNEMVDHDPPVTLERVAVYVVTGDPAAMISELASALDASVIIVGTHGRRGLERALYGSVASDVVRLAPCAVYVVRPADFVHGKKVPEIQPPLEPGQPHLKHFEHRRTYHYVDRVAPWTHRTMPAS